MVKISAESGGFAWSSVEQIYPDCKDSAGRVLYAKEVDCGKVPNVGVKQVAHGIASLDVEKIFHMSGSSNSSSSEGALLLVHTQNDPTYCVMARLVGLSNIEVSTYQSHWFTNNYYVKFRIIWAK